MAKRFLKSKIDTLVASDLLGFINGTSRDKSADRIIQNLGPELEARRNEIDSQINRNNPSLLGNIFAEVSGLDFGRVNVILFELFTSANNNKEQSWALDFCSPTASSVGTFKAMFLAADAENEGLVITKESRTATLIAPSSFLLNQLAAKSWAGPSCPRPISHPTGAAPR